MVKKVFPSASLQLGRLFDIQNATNSVKTEGGFDLPNTKNISTSATGWQCPIYLQHHPDPEPAVLRLIRADGAVLFTEGGDAPGADAVAPAIGHRQTAGVKAHLAGIGVHHLEHELRTV